MRKKLVAWIAFALVLGAGIFWWTSIKKRVVKDAVTKAVNKKTDSLYRVTYDTSEIDELNGNVYLRNVQVRVDSLQWAKLIEKDSMPPVTIAVTIDKITIKGLKELKLLSNSSLDVESIVLEKPVFKLDKWARKKKSADQLNDTVEVYKRLVGNFDFLRAKNIQVVNGYFTITDNLRKDIFSANGINVEVDDFLVDSAHNYRNIIGYFIKQTRATIQGVKGTDITTGKIVYDSKQFLLKVSDFALVSEAPVKFKTVEIAGLSTEAFITRSEITARRILIDYPNITIMPVSGKKPAKKEVVIRAGTLDSLIIRQGALTVHNRKTKPMYVRGINMVVKNIKGDNGRVNFEDYLNAKSSVLSVASLTMPMGFHNLSVKNIGYPGKADIISIADLQLKPGITRAQLKKGKQADMYTLTARNIQVEKMDLKKMLKNNMILIDKVSLQMDLHVFDDKTIPMDSAKRESGKFPYEKLRDAKTKVDIRTIAIHHSKIAYEEQAPKSGMNGTVFFTDVNGVATNITNIQERLAQDNALKIEATARLMGSPLLQSHWNMLLNDPEANFTVTGNVAPFPLPLLSPAFEPLSMATIKSGYAEKMDFEIRGNHEGSTGNVLLNYRDLKVDLLRKNKEDSLEKKGFLSFIANAAIRNKYSSAKGKDYTFKRDRYKSIFNLLWKSIFEGAKKSVLIVK